MMQILKQLKRFIRDLLIKLKFYYSLQSYSKDGPRIFYMMGLAKHFPNLGDQAQAAAIPLWFQKHFTWPVIHIKNNELQQCLPLLVRYIQPNDVVFLHSGGNFGDDWYQTQLDRESIIAALQENDIIQLPQTVYYSDTEKGTRAVKQSQQVISQHPNMLIFGRDVQSAALAQSLFPNKTVHARPDMVLSLHDYLKTHHAETFVSAENVSAAKRIKKVLLILRNDKEGIYQASDKQDLMQCLVGLGYEVEIWDTDVVDVFTEDGRLDTLVKYLSFIASFDAVITDRYHGLIFSVLIQRPCVVMKTHNHKLTSAFDWFDQVNYTHRADSHEEIAHALTALAQLTALTSPNWNTQHFDPMADEVKAFLIEKNPVVETKVAYT